jgi:hypothetical protein
MKGTFLLSPFIDEKKRGPIKLGNLSMVTNAESSSALSKVSLIQSPGSWVGDSLSGKLRVSSYRCKLRKMRKNRWHRNGL